MTNPMIPEECACFMTDPKTWTTYGSAAEPGSMWEPNPDCRVHFTDEERAASWPPCPPRTEGGKPHCPDCSGIVGETGVIW